MSDKEPQNKNLEQFETHLASFYAVLEIMNEYKVSDDVLFDRLLKAIPGAFTNSQFCEIKISLNGKTYQTDNYRESTDKINSVIHIQGEIKGSISVVYKYSSHIDKDIKFTAEDKKFIVMLSTRIGEYFTNRKLIKTVKELKNGADEDWRIWIAFIRNYDVKLYSNIARKLVIRLNLEGLIDEDEMNSILKKMGSTTKLLDDVIDGKYMNELDKDTRFKLYEETFDIVAKYLENDEIENYVKQMMHDSKHGYHIRRLTGINCTIRELEEAIRYFHHLAHQKIELPKLLIEGAIVHIIRFLLSEQLDFINVSKANINIHDFNNLMNFIIYPQDSRGRLGKKAADNFLTSCILEKHREDNKLLKSIKMPRTWYITSDGIYDFLEYNDLLDDLSEHKYKNINQIKAEEYYINQLFEGTKTPSWLESGLKRVLEDYNETPLIVRSSSLLGESARLKFSGQYAWKIIPNQGSFKKRLSELKEAIKAIYISTFGADPLKSRAEHGLIDFDEEMGVIIQEVIGKRINKYYFPAICGKVFRPGYNRRKTDQRNFKYAIKYLLGLSQAQIPEKDEIIDIQFKLDEKRKKEITTLTNVGKNVLRDIDAINLETGEIETVKFDDFVYTVCENKCEYLRKLIPSISRLNTEISGISINLEQDLNRLHQLLFTRETTAFIDVLAKLMSANIEFDFASNGEDIYILKCNLG